MMSHDSQKIPNRSRFVISDHLTPPHKLELQKEQNPPPLFLCCPILKKSRLKVSPNFPLELPPEPSVDAIQSLALPASYPHICLSLHTQQHPPRPPNSKCWRELTTRRTHLTRTPLRRTRALPLPPRNLYLLQPQQMIMQMRRHIRVLQLMFDLLQRQVLRRHSQLYLLLVYNWP